MYDHIGATSFFNAFFGAGTGPVYLDDFFCTGRESRLINCTNGGLNMIDNCRGHLDDAGVRCGKCSGRNSFKEANAVICVQNIVALSMA